MFEILGFWSEKYNHYTEIENSYYNRRKCFASKFIHNFFSGSNGHDFMFLLKGHEDLKQDERVMQLIWLIHYLGMTQEAIYRTVL